MSRLHDYNVLLQEKIKQDKDTIRYLRKQINSLKTNNAEILKTSYDRGFRDAMNKKFKKIDQ